MSENNWEDYDLKDQSAIRLYLADEVLYNILNEDSTVKLWLKLESFYMIKSLTNRLYLKQKLYTLQMREGMSISEYLNEFNKIICQLTSIRLKFEEEDKALILLSSFSLSYEHLVTTLLYENDSIDLEEVTTTILSNEMRKMGFVSEVQVKAEGLIAHKKTKGNIFDRSYQNFECYYSHKK